MLRRIFAIAKKEFYQILRDRKLVAIIFAMPIFLLILFGYAINFDVKNINFVVYDLDKSEISREFINTLDITEYFNLVKYIENEEEINSALEKKEAQLVIKIPDNFSKNILDREPSYIQYIIDGVDGNAATIIFNYSNAITANLSQKFAAEILSKKGIKISQPIEIRQTFLFNPELKTTQFLVPGLIGIILVITAVITVSLSIVKEKEFGTIEQINVSPIESYEFILGKTLPYSFISLLVATLILVAGYLMFGVSIKGNYFYLFISTLIFILAALSLGLFISVISDSQQIAFQISALVSLLPAVLLSGFVFPIESMPFIIQLLTNVTPTKFYLIILRSICLKGSGISAFYEQIIYLIIFFLVFLILSTLINKKRTLLK